MEAACNYSVKIDRETVERKTQKGMEKALYKASAYLMTMARRKIRYSKNKASKPGEPPHKHQKGVTSFSHTILFDVDKQNLSSYIGPIKKGPGVYSIPHVLEYGGISDESRNPWWYQKWGVPRGVKTKRDVANWLMNTKKAGPLFVSTTLLDLAYQVYNSGNYGDKRMGKRAISARLKANPDANIRKWAQVREIKKPWGRKKKILMFIVPIKTWKQAAKAATNIYTWFGPPKIAPHQIEARPFMKPTLQQNLVQVLNKFRNTI